MAEGSEAKKGFTKLGIMLGHAILYGVGGYVGFVITKTVLTKTGALRFIDEKVLNRRETQSQTQADSTNNETDSYDAAMQRQLTQGFDAQMN